jgi:ankyrin repeat protein
MASQKGNLNVVELLLARDADVDTQKADGETVLHLAAFYGHTEVAQVLLKNGADPRIKNKEGKTPSDFASKEGHDDIARSLKTATLVRVWGGGPIAGQQVGEGEMIAL